MKNPRRNISLNQYRTSYYPDPNEQREHTAEDKIDIFLAIYLQTMPILTDKILSTTVIIIKIMDPNFPFRDITQRVQNIQEITTNANSPINYQDIFNAIYTVVFITGLLYDNCDKYNEKNH